MAKKEKKKKLTIEEQIKELKAQLIANSKDADWAKKMLAKLTSLQRGSLVEPVELIVPTKEIKDTLDFGSCKISKTFRGYLFEAKGGQYTFVENRMTAVCAMLQTLFELNSKENPTEDEKQLYDSFSTAILYVFQSPIFSSLNEYTLFGVATDILKHFNEFCKENYEEAELKEESENDITENESFAAMGEAMQHIAEMPLPEEKD